jgi:hypothetical protein
MHLFSTNKLATEHNQQMLKFLNIPIELSSVDKRNNHVPSTFEDEKLDPKVLLFPSQKVMLTSNLWVAFGLVNDCLVKSLPYSIKKTINLPQLPTFFVVSFSKYIGPPWDPNNPTFVPIPPIQKGSHTHIPLKMEWELTINKSQGITLPKFTMDIGIVE